MTVRVPLRLRALAPTGSMAVRSGFRWLCEDGQPCKAGTAIAFCNIGLTAKGAGHCHAAFASEMRDFQAVIVLSVDGIVHIGRHSSRGGFLDRHESNHRWDADFVVGELECADMPVGEPFRLLLAAGRRTTQAAENRSGFLSGWYDRTRVWWADGEGQPGSLLSLGSCELSAAMRGDRLNSLEFLSGLPGLAQLVIVPEDLVMPCARIVLEQFDRTPEAFAAISADFAATFPLGSGSPADWFFAASTLSALRRTPITEDKSILVRDAVVPVECPDAIVMSLVAEPPMILRHRRLGYSFCLPDYRLGELGEAVMGWLRRNFEPVMREPDDIRRDYRELIDRVNGRSRVRFLILNLMSSSGTEDFLSYAPFDRPMRKTVGSVQSQEMNLMLHDLAAERDISIVDNDAIAAELGGAWHLPDGTHQSGVLQGEVRREVIRLLGSRGIPGFRASFPVVGVAA